MLELSEKYTAVAQKADEIETELKRIGWWSDTTPDPNIFEDMGAFNELS
ncbi:MAG: hypothetical protein ABIO72_03425 [Patescibacteria group bacterium]